MNHKTLHKISYGLYIICSKKGKKINGQIVNALFQVTAEPQTIAVSINKKNLTHEFIENSKAFTVSVLSENTPLQFIGTFGFKSGRDIDKFKDIRYKLGKTHIPIVLDNSLAYVEAKVIDKIDVGTHTIFIANVEDGEILTEDKPMTYEYYHKVKGGFSPKNAPTYVGEVDKEKKEMKKMDKYQVQNLKTCQMTGSVLYVELEKISLKRSNKNLDKTENNYKNEKPMCLIGR
jgi:flavin reductase (DIM6/NTAB) family NADH-FMN oxidoreductase RutF